MNRRTIFRWAIGGGLAAVLLLGMVLASGLISPIGRLQDLVGYGGAHSDAPEQGRHLFHTGADIGGEKEGMTYARFDASRDTNAARSFFGFGCLETCARHEAGYRWAVRHDVRQVADCIGFSWSEIEGCAAYALTRSEPGQGSPPRN